jgi:uncharacterized protein YigE (DUF2233 family)
VLAKVGLREALVSLRRIALIAIAITAPLARSAPAPPLAFGDVAPGIAHAPFSWTGQPEFTGHAFVVDLERVELRVIAGGPRGEHQSVEAIAARFPQHLAANASFFDENGRAMGRVVDLGKTVVAERRASWGALVVERARARIEIGEALPKAAPGGHLVVQGIPRLVVDGEVQKLKPAVARRTAVCADARELVIVVTASAAEASDFARFLAHPRSSGGLGCRNALNLDGGPSTQLHAALPGLELLVEGGWPVPNALIAIPR